MKNGKVKPMQGELLKAYTPVTQIIQIVVSIVIAITLIALVFSLNKYQPEQRLQALAFATQEVTAGFSSEQPLTIKNGEVLERDTKCLWINETIQGTVVPEYVVGYLRAGEIIERSGKTYGNYIHVFVDSSARIARSTNYCWIQN